MSELEDLKKRVAELEKAAKPPEPFVPMPRIERDPTAGACMHPNALRDMLKVSYSGLAEDLRAFQQQRTVTSSPAEPQRQRSSGWVEPRPIESPPGVAIADRLVDAQDRIDQAELAMKLAKVELSKRSE